MKRENMAKKKERQSRQMPIMRPCAAGIDIVTGGHWKNILTMSSVASSL
jgi:hypothetical protein